MANRKTVSAFVARKLVDIATEDRQKLVLSLASWLKDQQQTRQLDYLVNDISLALKQHDHIIVTLESARLLNENSRKTARDYVQSLYDGAFVEFAEKINPSLIGGLVIHTPDGKIDLSVIKKLRSIKRGV